LRIFSGGVILQPVNRLLLLAGVGLAFHYGPLLMKRAPAAAEAAPQVAEEPVVPTDFNRLQQEMQKNPNGYSDQERDIAKDVAAVYEQGSASAGRGNAPVLQNIMKTFATKKSETTELTERAENLWAAFKERYRALEPRYAGWFWIAPMAILLMGVAGFSLSRAAFARGVAEFGSSWSQRWLWAVAIAAGAWAAIHRESPLSRIPPELFLPPLAWLAGSAFLRRLSAGESFSSGRDATNDGAGPVRSASPSRSSRR
jgi:hypothetical protein